MADVIDMANDHAELVLHHALLRACARPAKSAVSAEFCMDCGDDIPQPRRIAAPGCDTCISCQTLRERRG